MPSPGDDRTSSCAAVVGDQAAQPTQTVAVGVRERSSGRSRHRRRRPRGRARGPSPRTVTASVEAAECRIALRTASWATRHTSAAFSSEAVSAPSTLTDAWMPGRRGGRDQVGERGGQARRRAGPAGGSRRAGSAATSGWCAATRRRLSRVSRESSAVSGLRATALTANAVPGEVLDDAVVQVAGDPTALGVRGVHRGAQQPLALGRGPAQLAGQAERGCTVATRMRRTSGPERDPAERGEDLAAAGSRSRRACSRPRRAAARPRVTRSGCRSGPAAAVDRVVVPACVVGGSPDRRSRSPAGRDRDPPPRRSSVRTSQLVGVERELSVRLSGIALAGVDERARPRSRC